MNKTNAIAVLVAAYVGGSLSALAELRQMPKREVAAACAARFPEWTPEWCPSKAAHERKAESDRVAARAAAIDKMVAHGGASSNAYRITKAAFVKANRC